MSVLRDKVAELDDLQQVHTYDDLPGSLIVFPCAVILPRTGRVDYSLGGPELEQHDVQITIFTASQILPEAQGVAVPFIKRMRDKLAGNIKLDASNGVDKILPTPGVNWYEGPGGIEYGAKMHTGIIFRYTVFSTETSHAATTYTVAI